MRQGSLRNLQQASLPKFEAFWALFPRKVAKKAAMQAWEKAQYEEIGDVVIAALKRQLPHMTEPKFIPHPRTWISQGRYEDQLHVEVRPAPAKPRDEREPWRQDDGWKAALNRVLLALVAEAKGVSDEVMARLLKGRDYHAAEFREMWGESAPRDEFDGIMANVIAQLRRVIRENPPQSG